jgi:hypothetical protein
MKRFQLREKEGADPQSYALGIKEVRSNIKSMSCIQIIDFRLSFCFALSGTSLLHLNAFHI